MAGSEGGVNHYRKWSSVTRRPVSAVSTRDLCHAFLSELWGSAEISETRGYVCACGCVTVGNSTLSFGQFVHCCSPLGEEQQNEACGLVGNS